MEIGLACLIYGFRSDNFVVVDDNDAIEHLIVEDLVKFDSLLLLLLDVFSCGKERSYEGEYVKRLVCAMDVTVVESKLRHLWFSLAFSLAPSEFQCAVFFSLTEAILCVLCFIYSRNGCQRWSSA